MKAQTKKAKGRKKTVQKEKGWFRNTVLYDTYRKIRTDTNRFGSIIIIDALFIGALFLINYLLNILIGDPQLWLLNAGRAAGMLTVVLLVYFAVMVLVYSFFKFKIMQAVHKYFSARKAEGWERFWSFYRSNLLLFGIFAAASIFFSAVFVMTVKLMLLETMRNAVMVVLGFFLYLCVGVMHPLMFIGKQKKLVRTAFKIVFNRLRAFVGLVVFTIVAFFVLAAVYYVFDWLVLLLLGEAMKAPVVYGGYALVNTLLAFVIVFGLIGFNRVYFYNILTRMNPKNI
jgi:hypothetical protein